MARLSDWMGAMVELGRRGSMVGLASLGSATELHLVQCFVCTKAVCVYSPILQSMPPGE